MGTVSQRIAKFAAELDYDDLLPETVNEAKRFLYDSLGCAFGGFVTKDVLITREVFHAMGGEKEATTLVCGTRIPAANAAFLNSLMINASDFNDIYWKQDPSHPSVLIPAVLALGERCRATGKEIILAIVVGYEFEMRLCEIAFPGIRERRWHNATLTQFASAIAAGKVLGLTKDQITNAIGISGAHNHTLGAVSTEKLSMMKNAADPFAVQSGVIAALLAEKGFEGPAHILDGKEGLTEAYGGNWNLDVLTEDLGSEYRIHQSAMKAFPVDGLAHSTLTGVIDIATDLDLWPEEVKSVEIETISRTVNILADPTKFNPTTREIADHSLPFCVASALVDKSLTSASFSDEQIKNQRLKKLMKRISIKGNMEFDKQFPEMQPSQVTIKTMDGREKTVRVDFPKGDPRMPMSQVDLDAKFNGLVENLVTTERQDQIKETIFDLENLPKISDLMALCTSDADDTN